MRDCLLCSVEYFTTNECRSVTDRKPYPNIHTFQSDSFESARQKSVALLEEFALVVRREEEMEPPTDPGVSSVFGV